MAQQPRSKESATSPSAKPLALIKTMRPEIKAAIHSLKLIFTTLVIVISLNEGICQNNLIGGEMGMYNRGLIGLSYHKILTFNERIMLSPGVGYGIGATPFGKQINQFSFLSFAFGYSPKFFNGKFYLCAGMDIKYLNYGLGEYDQNLDQYSSRHYEGSGIMPYLGISSFEKNEWFWQIRAAPLFLMKRYKIEDKIPGVGITFGKLI
jgi:hypothetical protein